MCLISPHDALVRIEGLTHTATGACIRPNVLAQGSYIIVAGTNNTTAHDQELPMVFGPSRGLLMRERHSGRGMVSATTSTSGTSMEVTKKTMCPGLGLQWATCP